VQLVDAETGAHLCADRFDKPVAGLFDMQDEIVSGLANTLNAQLTEEEARRSQLSPHPDSTDLFFQGKAFFNKGWTPEYLAQARGLFERALELDPKNVGAMVAMAAVDLVVGAYLTNDRAARLAIAETTLVQALCHAPNDASVHFVLGAVQMNRNRAVQGIAECERALALDRNLARAHAQIGAAKCFMGRAAETEAHILAALSFTARYLRLQLAGGGRRRQVAA
jgi:Tfp pilus assembly protein PilF